jgi:hypothetical protein
MAGISAYTRVIFEGRRTTARTVEMLKEARRIFTKNTGQRHPEISQGGYNAGGVSASAGTHDRDAMDFATSGWSLKNQQEWEKACWVVGFADWHRTRISGLWPEHNHGIPKGGDLSRGAANQVRAFQNKRDGLAGNRPYPRIGKYAHRTWEGYKKIHKIEEKAAAARVKAESKAKDLLNKRPLNTLSVASAEKARKGKYLSRYTYIIQVWLRRLGYYQGTRDGKWGPVTQAAFNNFRKKYLKWNDKDSTSPIGINSLTALAEANKSSRKVVK